MFRSRNRVQLHCKDPSRAIQSQAAEADINTIVRNFGVTGRVPQAVRLPEYGDFSGIDDYQSALHAVMDAERSFMALPAAVRSKFQNNPQAFASFCLDPANLEELRKLGLAASPPAASTSPPAPAGTAA